jgi:ribonuclease J
MVIENGDMLEIHPDHLNISAHYPASLVFVDGQGVGDVDSGIMRERESLAEDGFLVVQLVIDQDGNLLGKPVILSQGFIQSNGSSEMIDELNQRVIEKAGKANGNLKKEMETMVRSFLYSEVRRSPRVFVTISQV